MMAPRGKPRPGTFSNAFENTPPCTLPSNRTLMQKLLDLYKTWRKQPAQKVETLAKAGSNRRYIRMYASDGSSVIGVIGPSLPENHCFVYLASHFTSKGLPFPRVYAFSEDETCYIQQDLGRHALYDELFQARSNEFSYGQRETQLLARTIRLLSHVQVEGAQGLDFNRCLEPKCFDARAAMFDLNYFKYSFLKTTDIHFNELCFEDDLQQLAKDLVGSSDENHFFLYRDFQARNVMLLPPLEGNSLPRPFFIDFQGGMKGPLQYDVASFLWQASARYPQWLREKLITEYIAELQTLLSGFDQEAFKQKLRLFVLFRILQVLGAYGLRGYVERKKYFLDSIPHAIQNLREQILGGVCEPYPCLDQTLKELCSLPRFTQKQPSQALNASPLAGKSALKVRILSFSYKKGIPDDPSGHGGGYVFDCRGTHNPGKYEAYKHLTGLDVPVMRFLEDDGEILNFLDSIYKIADAHVQRYIERGFTNLQFAFGCTGGQHRSVYCAQHLAEHLHHKFGVEIELLHREQRMEKTFPRK